MKADIKTETAVMSVMNQFFIAFENRDPEGVLAIFAPDPDVVFIGTGVDEKCIGPVEIRAELERAFAQSEEVSIESGWYSVSAAGPVAWVAVDVDIQAKVGEQEINFPVRFTTVMECRGDKWLIVQSHDSIPASGQKEGKSWPTE
jgi:uncharacterized protein (TIGR02246 family)